MSDRPISVGDLVVCVRACCDGCGKKAIGKVFNVNSIGEWPRGFWNCIHCGAKSWERRAESKGCEWFAPLSWLKRIPPMEELEGERTEEALRLICPVPSFPTIREKA